MVFEEVLFLRRKNRNFKGRHKNKRNERICKRCKKLSIITDKMRHHIIPRKYFGDGKICHKNIFMMTYVKSIVKSIAGDMSVTIRCFLQ